MIDMECFNLVYRLLAVSFITLVLIGIGLGWVRRNRFAGRT